MQSSSIDDLNWNDQTRDTFQLLIVPNVTSFLRQWIQWQHSVDVSFESESESERRHFGFVEGEKEIGWIRHKAKVYANCLWSHLTRTRNDSYADDDLIFILLVHKYLYKGIQVSIVDDDLCERKEKNDT